MSIKFPTIVYKTPGDHHCPGGTFKYMQATSKEHFDELKESGWFATLPEAINKMHNDFKEEVDNEEEPMTRDEIESMAKELGIQFKSTISDQNLLKRINDKLGD